MSEVPRPGAPEQQPFSANSLLSDIGDAVLKVELGQLDAAEALAELKLLAGIYFTEKKAGKTFDKDVELAIQTELRKLKAEADKLTAATSAAAGSPATPTAAPTTPTPIVHTPPAAAPAVPPPRVAAPLPTPTPPPSPRATVAPPPAAGGPPATPGTPEAPDPEYLAILARIRAFQSTIDSIVDATPPNAPDVTRALQELVRFRREIPGLSSRGRNKEAADLKTRLDELDAAYKADLEKINAPKPKEDQSDLERELTPLPLFEVLFSRMHTDSAINTTKEMIYERTIKQKVDEIVRTTANVAGEREWEPGERAEFAKLINECVVPLMEFGVFNNKTINTWDVTVQDPDALLDAIGVAAPSTKANAELNSNLLVGSVDGIQQIDRHQYRPGMGPIQQICCVMYSLMNTIGSEGGFDVSKGRYTGGQSKELVDYICAGRDFEVELPDGTTATVNPGNALRHLPEKVREIVMQLALFKASRDDLAQKASNKIMAFEGKSPKINGGSNSKDYVAGFIARALYNTTASADNGRYMFLFSYADPSRINPLKVRAGGAPESPLDFSRITTEKFTKERFSRNDPLVVIDAGYLASLQTTIRNPSATTQERKLAEALRQRAARSLIIRQKMNLMNANNEFRRPGFDRRSINVVLDNWDDDFPSIDDFTNRPAEGGVARSAAEYKMARDAFKKIIDMAYESNRFHVSHDVASARTNINATLSDVLTQYAKMLAYMGTGVVNPAASSEIRYLERYNSYHKLARSAIRVVLMNILMKVPGDLKREMGSGKNNKAVYERRKIVLGIIQSQIDNYPSIATGVDVDLSSLHRELTMFLDQNKSWLVSNAPPDVPSNTIKYNDVRLANVPELQQLTGDVRSSEVHKGWHPPFS